MNKRIINKGHSTLDLMIRGLIEQRNVDLEDVIYWLKDIVNDYEYDIKREIEEEKGYKIIIR